MYVSYFIIALRHIKKQIHFTVINIVGLALAISCATAFYHIIAHELSFDRWHEKSDQLYMVSIEKNSGKWRSEVHYPAAEMLRQDFPDFEMVTRTHGPHDYKISIEKEHGDRDHFNEILILFVDSYFLQLFDFQALTSFNFTILDEPGYVILTKTLAQKYFADKDPIGKLIYIRDSIPLQVAGIMADPGRNTCFHFNMLISAPTFDKLQRDPKKIDDWLFASGTSVFASLKANDNPEKYKSRLEEFTWRYAAFFKGDYYYRLYPLKQLHTDTHFEGNYSYYTSPPELIWLPATLAILILFIAAFNFINLTTAQNMQKGKEVGIRTVAGSTRWQLYIRFTTEIIIIISISSLLSMIFSHWLLLEVNKMFEIINYQLSLNSASILFMVALALLLIILTSIYPVVLLLRLKPQEVLKNKLYAGRGHANNTIRKGLIVFQLSCSFLILIAALVIGKQISVWQNTDLKFRAKNLLVIDLPVTSTESHIDFKNRISRISGIESVSISSNSPMDGRWGSAQYNDETEAIPAGVLLIDYDFLNTYNLNLIAGNLIENSVNRMVIINRKLASELGFIYPEEALNEEITVDVAFREKFKANIHAVMEDNIDSPLKNVSTPKVYILNAGIKDISYGLHVAVNENYTGNQIESIFKEFKSTFPDEVFEWESIEEKIAIDYILESLIKKAVSFGSIIAILIACIGLYGVISFMAIARKKEVGIRKVNGAAKTDIIMLFAKEFVLLVMISFAITAPVSSYLMNNWLQQYTYRIGLQPIFFIQALLFITALSFLSILQGAWQSARINPSDVLKTD
jgi:putative ABC transport system permease protein